MDGTNHGVNHQPKMMTVVPVTGKTAHFIIDGDSTSANYQKVLLYFDGIEVASSTTAYNWTTFASSAWVHLSFSKENPTVGSYTYRVFVNGVAMIELVSTEDIGLDDVYWASDSTPSASDAFLVTLTISLFLKQQNILQLILSLLITLKLQLKHLMLQSIRLTDCIPSVVIRHLQLSTTIHNSHSVKTSSLMSKM